MYSCARQLNGIFISALDSPGPAVSGWHDQPRKRDARDSAMSTAALSFPKFQRRHSVLPGFGLALGFALLYLSLIVLIPLSATFFKAATMGWSEFWEAVTTPRVLASYRLTFGASFLAALINAVFGTPRGMGAGALLAFPEAHRRCARGSALCLADGRGRHRADGNLRGNGWIGRCLEPLGIKVAFTPLGVLVALTFIGLPFVVRMVQPVLEDLEPELEEAAATLGATRLADLHARDPPYDRSSLADWLRAGVCAGDRGVWLCDLHRRQHADGHRDHAAADHHEAGTIRLRGGNGDRGRDACDLLHAAADRSTFCSGGAPTPMPQREVVTMSATAIQIADLPHRRPRSAATRNRAGFAGCLTGIALALPGLFLFVPLAAVFHEALRKGVAAYFAAIIEPDALSAIRLTLLTAVHRRAAQPGLRRRRRLGHRQVRVPRQERADHADRPALRGFARHLRPDLRAALRRAGLVRPLARRSTTSRSSSPCPASCSPPSS